MFILLIEQKNEPRKLTRSADFLTQHFSIKTAKIAELVSLKQPYFCRFYAKMLLKIQCRDLPCIILIMCLI